MKNSNSTVSVGEFGGYRSVFVCATKMGSQAVRGLLLGMAALLFTGCASTRPSTAASLPAVPETAIEVHSAYIATIEYADGSLTVSFRDGSKQRFDGVPAHKVDALRRTGGKLGYFKAHIKNQYPRTILEKSFHNREDQVYVHTRSNWADGVSYRVLSVSATSIQ